MNPAVATHKELSILKAVVDAAAEGRVSRETGTTLEYMVGTNDRIAARCAAGRGNRHSANFLFGTNDLTQDDPGHLAR